MLSFKPILLTDRSIIQSFVGKTAFPNGALSFSNLCGWGVSLHYEYAIMNDYLLLRFQVEDRCLYVMPVGCGDLQPILNALITDAKQCGHPFYMVGVSAEMQQCMEAVMPGAFRFIYSRDFSDYIYLRSDLVMLKGKKLQSKRNHVHRFSNLFPQFEYHSLTPDRVEDCLSFESGWLSYKMPYSEATESLNMEREMIQYALHHITELSILGGTLYVDGKLVAFTFGSPINRDTFDVSVEKANTSYEGAYAMINNLFSKSLPEQYLYVNREEDMGVEGLRKAKLSYQPFMLLEKMDVTLMNE